MLPALLPDMTLFSLVAAAHRMNGASRGEHICQTLFGNAHAGMRHDFPSHLDEFCARTSMTYGLPDDLALRATVLPYFLRFRHQEVQSRAISQMRGNSVERLKFVLGLPPGPSGGSISLASCIECMREDIGAYGFAYWHRRHQLPGVQVCHNHGIPVQHSNMRLNGCGRTRLFLPSDAEFNATCSSQEIGVRDEILHRVAVLSASALDKPLSGGYSPQVLQATYQHGLKQQGLLSAGGRVRATEFVKWLRDRYCSIVDVPVFNRVAGEPFAEGMLRLVRKPRGNFHTLSHLLLIDALFGGWDAFISVYEWERQMELPLVLSDERAIREDRLQSDNEILAVELARRHENGEGSLTALSKELGIDVSTAMRWLGKLGLIDVQRRPRILTTEIRMEIVKALRKGEPLREIAKSFALSRATIDRICNEQAGLQQLWRAANHERKRADARASLTMFLRNNPSISLAELRSAKSSGYSWLSRHDKDWLRNMVPARAGRHRSRLSTRPLRVDWVARDRKCVAALKSIETTIRFESWERLKPMVVLRKIPRMSFVPRLDRLPESRELVMQILVRAGTRRRGNYN